MHFHNIKSIKRAMPMKPAKVWTTVWLSQLCKKKYALFLARWPKERRREDRDHESIPKLQRDWILKWGAGLSCCWRWRSPYLTHDSSISSSQQQPLLHTPAALTQHWRPPGKTPPSHVSPYFIFVRTTKNRILMNWFLMLPWRLVLLTYLSHRWLKECFIFIEQEHLPRQRLNQYLGELRCSGLGKPV